MKKVIFGKNSVLEAAKTGVMFKKVFVLENLKKKNEILRKIEGNSSPGTKPVFTSRQDMLKITGTEKHGGIAVETAMPVFIPLQKLQKLSERFEDDPFFLVLDQIQDPNNFGAIIRTADAAGVHGIIICKDNSVQLTPAVIKTSAGAAYHVPVAQVTNLARTLTILKKSGVWIAGAESSGSVNYQIADLTGPIALVIGSEGKGLRRLTQEACDYKINIPMAGKVSSLNASVSAGILLYEISRQRNIKKLKKTESI